MDKKLLTVFFFVLLIFVFESCSKQNFVNKKKETLVVANWKGYGSDTEYAVDLFEERNNCNVVHQYFNSEQDLEKLLSQKNVNKIDVLLLNLPSISVAAREKVLKKLNISQLVHYKNINVNLKNQKELQDKYGNLYGIPWVWGTTGIVYNPDFITKIPLCYKDLTDPAYKGKIAFSDDYFAAVLTAAIAIGAPDPYNPNLNEVKSFLLQIKKNSKILWSSSEDFTQSYIKDDITLGNLWSGTATQLAAEGSHISYVYPEEGVIAWQDNWCITENTSHENLAYKWLNWMTSEEFLFLFVSDLKSQPPIPANDKVLEILPRKLQKSLWIYPSIPSKMVMSHGISKEKALQWKSLWNTIKAFR